jgi:hypothetical protein
MVVVFPICYHSPQMDHNSKPGMYVLDRTDDCSSRTIVYILCARLPQLIYRPSAEGFIFCPSISQHSLKKSSKLDTNSFGMPNGNFLTIFGFLFFFLAFRFDFDFETFKCGFVPETSKLFSQLFFPFLVWVVLIAANALFLHFACENVVHERWEVGLNKIYQIELTLIKLLWFINKFPRFSDTSILFFWITCSSLVLVYHPWKNTEHTTWIFLFRFWDIFFQKSSEIKILIVIVPRLGYFLYRSNFLLFWICEFITLLF